MSSVSLTRLGCSLGWKHFAKTRNAQHSKTLYYHCWSVTNVPDIQKQNNYKSLLKSPTTCRTYTKHTNDIPPIKNPELDEKDNEADSTKKIGLFKRFKQMYRDYWYVLIPVHVVTSTCWAGLFYYTAKSGVDVIALLETMKVSAKLIDNIKDSNMGYIALTYALYKIATPARYAVTLAGTTLSINYLKRWGYLKPVPSREKLKFMYREKKEELQEKYQERRDGFQDMYQAKRQIMKEKKQNLWEDIVKRSQSKYK